MSGSRMGGVLRRAIGSLVTLALIAAAIGFYVGSPRLLVTSGPGPVTTAEPAPTQRPIRSATPSSAPTPTPTATKAAGNSADRDLPPGPGGQDPGIRLTATPTAQGEFDVVEKVRLAEPVARLTIAPPDLTPVGSLRGTRPVAEALEVTAGNNSIKMSNDTVRRATVLRIATPVDWIELRYRLRGVTVISTPSSAGRALGGIGPLVIGVPEELPVAVTVRGHSVRNLSCPCLPVDDQACAAGPRPKVRVNRNLARRDALVLVQFDIAATRIGAPR